MNKTVRVLLGMLLIWLGFTALFALFGIGKMPDHLTVMQSVFTVLIISSAMSGTIVLGLGGCAAGIALIFPSKK